LAVPASAQTADDIIAKNHEAQGGLAKLRAVQSVRMTGRMTIGLVLDAPVVLEMKRPRMMRIDIVAPGMTISQAFDGTTGWMINPMSGRSEPEVLPREMLKLVEEQADMDGPLMDYRAKGNTVEFLGSEMAEGADCYKLKLTLKNGDVRTFYFDKVSFLAVKLESRTMMGGSEQLGDTIIGNYKEVGGLIMAHSIDTGQAGQLERQKTTFDKIEVNVPIDDTRFRMPQKK
jgi:outer membrane lipoprotein-sorting protein